MTPEEDPRTAVPELASATSASPGASPVRVPGSVSVVICTRDRPDELARCLVGRQLTVVTSSLGVVDVLSANSRGNTLAVGGVLNAALVSKASLVVDQGPLSGIGIAVVKLAVLNST